MKDILKPEDISKAPIQRLLSIDSMLRQAKRNMGLIQDCKVSDSKLYKAEFDNNYPDYSGLLNLPYEEIAAYHTLILEELNHLKCKMTKAWAEPRYTGRGVLAFQDFNNQMYESLCQCPEHIFKYWG